MSLASVEDVYKCPPVVQRYLENIDSLTLDELAN